MEAFRTAWRKLKGAERDAKASVIGAGRRYLDNVAIAAEDRKLSPELVVGVELAFEGRLTCNQLAPELPWLRLPDPSWPHKRGRPVLDFGAAKVSRQKNPRRAAVEA